MNEHSNQMERLEGRSRTNQKEKKLNANELAFPHRAFSGDTPPDGVITRRDRVIT